MLLTARTIDVSAWIGAWHEWLVHNSSVLDQANHFPVADQDTGKNLVSLTTGLLPALRAWPEPARRAGELDTWRTHRWGSSSGLFVEPTVLALASLPAPCPNLGEVARVFASLSQAKLYQRFENGVWRDETRTEGPPAAFAAAAVAFADPAAAANDLDALFEPVLEASKCLNRGRWVGSPAAVPPDAGTLAIAAFFRLAPGALVGG